MKTPKITLVLLVLLVILGTTTAIAFVRPRSVAPPSSNLTGELLVANRQLVDPNFAKCVIYVIAHSEDGAMGLIVNRVYGTMSLQEMLGAFGIETREKRKVELYYGGPVEIRRGFVLHSGDYTGVSTLLLGKDMALSTGLDVMQAVAEGRGPERTRFLLGYAGWGAGQLEHELARSDWLIAPADPSLIFSSDPGAVWEKALQRAGIAL
ncbi:MAG TPA: YqgE/AlgH family protein [Methylococcaceae bacterium]|jgi:putative transcriptional regulator|nr:YqgE/AlgH family protein [Methylococcaceae bacterium]